MNSGREPLVRVGEVSVAAVAALTVSISLCAWAMQVGKPADAQARSDHRSDAPAATGAVASFEDRFTSFADRFGAATSSESIAGTTVAVAPAIAPDDASATPAADLMAPARAPRPAALVPVPRPAPRSVASNRPAVRYRVASLSDTPPPAAAAADATPSDSGIIDVFERLTRARASDAAAKDAAPTDATTKDANPLAVDPSHTAIYDISARTVYLPTGERLEAHSGLGGYMDDVRSVHLRHRGPTPPNVYELELRESPFHGVQAIRLNPVDARKMHGRDGILAHPFMLGPDGQSNGCVSVKDYPAFLNAYRRGEITRLVVVEQLDDAPGARTAADWFSSTLKRIFGRS
jgi:hypothetical protein